MSRTARLEIRLTPLEKIELQRLAKAHDMTLTEYIIHKAIGEH